VNYGVVVKHDQVTIKGEYKTFNLRKLQVELPLVQEKSREALGEGAIVERIREVGIGRDVM
jgi:hypothetical protein